MVARRHKHEPVRPEWKGFERASVYGAGDDANLGRAR
jgi:hypothetical protein